MSNYLNAESYLNAASFLHTSSMSSPSQGSEASMGESVVVLFTRFFHALSLYIYTSLLSSPSPRSSPLLSLLSSPPWSAPPPSTTLKSDGAKMNLETLYRESTIFIVFFLI